MATIDCTRPSQRQLEEALELIQTLCRNWYAVDGLSACDLLDETLHNALVTGVVTQEQLNAWAREEPQS